MSDNDNLPPTIQFGPDFDDGEQMLNMRGWLQKACESQGAKMIGGGCGMGEADIDISLEGFDYNIRIRPHLKGQ